MLVMAGADRSPSTLSGLTCRSDIWRSRSGGVGQWESLGVFPWSARFGLAAVVSSSGTLVVAGGSACDSGFTPQNDAWASADGTSWQHLLSRSSFAAVRLPSGSILITGGAAGFSSMSDVVVSSPDGSTLTRVASSAPWSARGGHTMVALPDSSIVLIGGTSENPLTASTAFNDVWRSRDGGISWTMVTGPGSNPVSAPASSSSIFIVVGAIVAVVGASGLLAALWIWRQRRGSRAAAGPSTSELTTVKNPMQA